MAVRCTGKEKSTSNPFSLSFRDTKKAYSSDPLNFRSRAESSEKETSEEEEEKLLTRVVGR